MVMTMPLRNQDERETWVRQRLEDIRRDGAVAFQPDGGMARRRLIAFSAFTVIPCLVAVVAGIVLGRTALIVGGALIGVLFLGFWIINYRVESTVSRLTLTPAGLRHDKLKGGAWTLQWFHRWCDFTEIRNVRARVPGSSSMRRNDMGTRARLTDGTHVLLPDLVFAGDLEAGRELLQAAHRFFLDSSRSVSAS